MAKRMAVVRNARYCRDIFDHSFKVITPLLLFTILVTFLTVLVIQSSYIQNLADARTIHILTELP